MQKPPEEVYFAMAAATMDSMGRLFLPYVPKGVAGNEPAAIYKSERQEGNTKEGATEKTIEYMRKNIKGTTGKSDAEVDEIIAKQPGS